MNTGTIKNKNNIGIVLPRWVQKHKWDEYGLIILNALLHYSNKYHYTILYFDNEILQWLSIPDETVKFVQIERTTVLHKLNGMINLTLGKKLLPMASKEQAGRLNNAHVDLYIYPFHSLYGYLNDISYIVTITNLMYKYYSNIRERATEYFADIVCRNAAKYSVSTVVDSTQGKNDVAKFFDIPKDKIRIIPHIPPNYIVANRDMTFKTINEVLAKYELPEKYVFYPAQFWHHKNHLRLIQALKKISDTHSSIVYLVMTGHPYESYNNVMSLIRQLHMSNQIVHLGYVTDVEMVALYKKSVALVYPTLYGPTNIPPSEAMMLGVPVLCSNLFSMPEQLGDAGLLFDPFNIDDMAEKIFKIWTNENLRTQLIQKGYARVRNLTEENYARQWERVIDDAFEKLQKLS